MGNGQSTDGGLTPVMVQLTATELGIVNTLITAGIANGWPHQPTVPQA